MLNEQSLHSKTLMNRDSAELFLLEDQLLVEAQPIGVPVCDFDFRSYFRCRTLWGAPPELPLVARVGAFDDYSTWYELRCQDGLIPIHTPDDHVRCSQLNQWYPIIKEYTPRSRVYHSRPTADEVTREFDWPVFVKGVRQTSRHQRKLSIASSAADFTEIMAQYENDAILRWQPVAVREFVPLRLVEDAAPERIPSSYEFRTFWWNRRNVGAGRYWWQGRPYDWTATERAEALQLGQIVADRLNVPFLVVDLAMTASGQWIVIECNDGQESGYAGVSPLAMWSTILQPI